MRRDFCDKLKRAGEYQRKAIMELLPEGMEGHLKVIKNELRQMAAETIGRTIMDCFETQEPGETSEPKKVNKVKIQ